MKKINKMLYDMQIIMGAISLRRINGQSILNDWRQYGYLTIVYLFNLQFHGQKF